MNHKIERKLHQAASARVPEVDLWDDIRRQIEINDRKIFRPAGRNWKFALGVVVIALLALAASPQARALAQGIIQQIGNIKFVPETPEFLVNDGALENQPPSESGGFDQTDQDAQAEMSELDREAYEKYGLIFSEGLSEEQKAAILAEFANRPDTVEEAESLMGDHVLQPAVIPPGYSFSKIEAYQTESGVLSTYTHFYQYDQSGEYRSSITLTQVAWPADAPDQFGNWPIGEEAEISDTTVRGLPAKYVQGAEISIVPFDILSWEEGGYDFSIMVESGELSLEELLEFAAGLE